MNRLGHDEMPASLQPAWEPTPDFISTTNLAWLMRRVGVESYEALHQWSVQQREKFWALAIERLGIRFQRPFMQSALKRELNPLFRIHGVVFVAALPRTASNKVMRRVLREQYLQSSS